MLTGLMAATLSHDDGRRFVELGWNLERIDMTARLLSSCLADPAATSSWVSVLRSCGSHEAFLRTYRRAADGPTVAEFLLLDRLFPRSAHSALTMVERLLAELDTTSKTTSAPHVHVQDEARQIAGRTRASLEFQIIDELMNHLPALLSLLQDSCSTISAHITQRYFPHHALSR